MKLTFFGAAKAVTGSCHCVEVCGKKILVDCGLQQGKDEPGEKGEDAQLIGAITALHEADEGRFYILPHHKDLLKINNRTRTGRQGSS